MIWTWLTEIFHWRRFDNDNADLRKGGRLNLVNDDFSFQCKTCGTINTVALNGHELNNGQVIICYNCGTKHVYHSQPSPAGNALVGALSGAAVGTMIGNIGGAFIGAALGAIFGASVAEAQKKKEQKFNKEIGNY